MTEIDGERRASLGRALDRFGEMLARDASSDRIVRDAAIHRFEFSIEVFWRVVQAALRREGIAVVSPRATARAAYAQGLA